MSAPIKVLQGGTLGLMPNDIVLKNWQFDMGGRTGPFETHNVEVMIAVRDYVNARFDAALMMQSDEHFESDRLTEAMIVQMMRMPKSIPMPVPKKKSWWRWLFGA